MDIFNRRERRNLIEAAQHEIGGLQPPQISTRGNRFALVDASKQRFDWPAFSIDVVVLDVNEHKSKVYWPEFNPSDEGGPPICFSDNGVAPSTQAAQPQSPTCEACPWNVWGSAINEKTGANRKACSDRKKVAVLVLGDTAAMPYQLQIPPASLKAWSAYSSQVAAMHVPGQNSKADLDYVITRVSFVPNKTGELSFQCVGWISSVQQTENGGFSIANDGQRVLMAADRGQAIAAYMDRIIDGKLTDMIVGRLDKPRDLTLPPPVQQAQIAHAATTANPAMPPMQPEHSTQWNPNPVMAKVLVNQLKTGTNIEFSQAALVETERPIFDATAMAQAQQRGPAPSAPVSQSSPGHGGPRQGAGRPKKAKAPAALASEPATGAQPLAAPRVEPFNPPASNPSNVVAPFAQDDGIPAELRRSPPANPAFATPTAAPSDIDQALATAFNLKT